MQGLLLRRFQRAAGCCRLDVRCVAGSHFLAIAAYVNCCAFERLAKACVLPGCAAAATYEVHIIISVALAVVCSPAARPLLSCHAATSIC